MFKMQRLEVSCAVRLIYMSLGAKGLFFFFEIKLNTVTDMPMGLTSNIAYCHYSWKKTVSNWKRTLTKDYPALVHSLLWVHNPVYSLLSSIVCWCSQHWRRSRTQYFTDALPPLCNAQCSSAVTISLSLCRLHSLSATRNTVIRRDTTVHFLLSAGLT